MTPATPPALAALVALAALAVLAPAADAHAAGAPRAQDTRLLHDHNDDCGGDGVTAHCGGSLDLVALDVQERHEASGPVVAFRFVLDRGADGGRHDLSLRYDAADGPRTFVATTTDHVAFNGTFGRIGPAQPTGDGSRFLLEAVLSPAAAGLAGPGDRIAGFRVEARHDGALGDLMPGGYAGPPAVQDPDQGDEPTNYAKPDYVARGTGHYVALDAPAGGAAGTWQVRNLLDTAQTVTLRLAAEGGEAGFAGGGAERTLEVGRRGSVDVVVEARGEGEGRVTLEATTSLGGRTVAQAPFSAQGTDDPGDGDPTGTGEGTPGLPPALLLVAIAALAGRMRGP